MKAVPILALAILSGCVHPAVKETPPCAGPVHLPNGWLNDRQVEVFWGRDRTALRDCAAKVEVLSGRKPQ